MLLILAGAVGYLTIYYRRRFKGGAGGGCGCDCGIPLKRSRDKDAASAGTQQFIPADNLADLAARHREERDAQCHTGQSGSCCCSERPDKRDNQSSP